MAAPLRIFVVENNDDTRFMLQLLLERLGHEVSSVSTVESALAALQGGRYDVLISDIGLPDGTGWQLLAALAPEQRPATALAMSGFAGDDDRARSLAAGFDRHLAKPLQLDTLLALLEDADARRQAQTG